MTVSIELKEVENPFEVVDKVIYAIAEVVKGEEINGYTVYVNLQDAYKVSLLTMRIRKELGNKWTISRKVVEAVEKTLEDYTHHPVHVDLEALVATVILKKSEKQQTQEDENPYEFEVEIGKYKGYRCPRHGVVFYVDQDRLSTSQRLLLVQECEGCGVAEKYSCPIPKRFKPLLEKHLAQYNITVEEYKEYIKQKS